MSFLDRLFGRTSGRATAYQTRVQKSTCDGCGGSLRVQGMPYYHCARCSRDYCNPCALGKGRAHSTATVACLSCNSDVRTGRTWA